MDNDEAFFKDKGFVDLDRVDLDVVEPMPMRRVIRVVQEYSSCYINVVSRIENLKGPISNKLIWSLSGLCVPIAGVP